MRKSLGYFVIGDRFVGICDKNFEEIEAKPAQNK